MAINFQNNPATQPAQAQQQPTQGTQPAPAPQPTAPPQVAPQQAAPQSQVPLSQQAYPSPPQPAPQPAPMVPQQPAPVVPPANASFLMTGAQQQTVVSQITAQQQLRSRLRTNVREFWLNPGSLAKVYFLDGILIGEGIFDTPMVATHGLDIGGRFHRIICNQAVEGECIVCAGGGWQSTPQTFQLFSIINTQPYVIKNGPRKGTTLNARLQLFPATMKVREKLVRRATKAGGALAGNLFTCIRHSDTDPRTGDDIEHEGPIPMEQMLAQYPNLGVADDGKTPAPTAPIDYTRAYPVLTNAEIAMLRPDLAQQAGYTSQPGLQPNVGEAAAPLAAVPGTAAPAAGVGDDEIPF